jgi:hypothetical protein
VAVLGGASWATQESGQASAPGSGATAADDPKWQRNDMPVVRDCGPDDSVLPVILRDAFRENGVFDQRGERIQLHSNVSLAEAVSLYRIVGEIKPQVSAEVGFAQGVSTLAILQAHADHASGIHHVIDPFQGNFGDVGLEMVKRARLESRLCFHRKFVEEVVPDLPPLQFAFIDASHLFDLTLVEFVLMDKRLEIGGMIAFHDTWMPSLQKVVRYILANRDYEVVPTVDLSGLSGEQTVKWRIKAIIRAALHCVPGKARLFRDEVLRPWDTFRLPNMVVFRKQAEDKRDWTFHQSF